jgi:selenocysteine-specific elongation factor
MLGIRSQKPFDALMRALQANGLAKTDGAVVSSAGFQVLLNVAQRRVADAFLASACANPFAPPAPEDCGVPTELVGALVALGEVERISGQIVYPTDVFETIRQRVLDKLNGDGQITLAEYRDLFGTSRKFAQSTLEHLDELRVTRRKGDARVRFVGPGAAC